MPVTTAQVGMRKDTWVVSVNVEGVGDLGTFDVRTGGEFDSTELKYQPGGMAPMVSLGGSITIGQLIVSRNFRADRDLPKAKALVAGVGKAKVSVNMVGLDPDKHPYDTRLGWRGVLKRVTLPEVDSTTTEAAVIELEITPEGSALV